MYVQDIISSVIVTILLWILLLYVIVQVKALANSALIAAVICFSGIGVGVAATAAAFAVLIHLKKNKLKIYNEELKALNGE